jgi:hypothetical protein
MVRTAFNWTELSHLTANDDVAASARFQLESDATRSLSLANCHFAMIPQDFAPFYDSAMYKLVVLTGR